MKPLVAKSSGVSVQSDTFEHVSHLNFGLLLYRQSYDNYVQVI